MSKFKKRIFIISMVVTIIICGVAAKMIIDGLKPQQEYSVHSGMKVSNLKGMLELKNNSIDNFLDKDNNIKIDFEIYNYNDRKVKYEMTVLVNYHQKSFKKDNLELQKYEFELSSQGCNKYSVTLDKKAFKYQVNDVVIVLRQDTDVYSDENELVSDTNTICRHYIIENNSSEETIVKTQKIKISELDDDLDTEASLKCMNMKKTLGISVDKNQKIKLKIDMKNNEIGTDYILVCLLNGNQISINNKDYMTYSDDLENMEIYAPDKSGKYEMEFLCIPNLSNAVINTEKEIPVISSNRYTLEVE
ncbi:hypothetical protein H8S00_09335 [Eubacterium sp. BX4]|uniref:DUF4352 domain-containing protein n=1 Tax=Eubacterium segne TaxID=2763045 RepID=A0ABR7F3I9_9FIRM|nr:hypothetical protein [Eubacterium segne]MBC5668184.1 hypothetical protein [Eubacterium segne]